MKKLFFILLIGSGLFSISFTPNEGEIIYVDWTHIAESPTHYEVEYRIVKCGSVNQVHLFLFNESVDEQKARFSLELLNNTTKEKAVKVIDFNMEKLTMYKALCDADKQLSPLRISLPEGFDPKNTSLKVIF